MSYPTFLNRVERAVRDEREAQDAKWGEQNHPDGTGGVIAALNRDIAQERCQQAIAAGVATWESILTAKVRGVSAEEDPVKLRAELIQAAAIAMEWAEAIDRREALKAARGGA